MTGPRILIRPALESERAVSEFGERLDGNVGGAWRVGETVRRATGPWTPAVHALLYYLGPRISCIPEVLGFDEHGREILSYLPGRVVDIDSELLTTGQLQSVVAWTHSFHRAVDAFHHIGPWRFSEVGEPTLVGHNDIAPYNICFDGDNLVGVFDWDLAGPSTPLLELAFIAWNCVPLWRDIGRGPAAARLDLIASTYGSHSALEILHAVPQRIQLMLDWIPRAAAAGDQGIVNLMSVGEPERSQRSLQALMVRLPTVSALLS